MTPLAKARELLAEAYNSILQGDYSTALELIYTAGVLIEALENTFSMTKVDHK